MALALTRTWKCDSASADRTLYLPRAKQDQGVLRHERRRPTAFRTGRPIGSEAARRNQPLGIETSYIESRDLDQSILAPGLSSCRGNARSLTMTPPKRGGS